MSIETLNNAARAAGFAMASPEEPPEGSRPEAEPEAEAWQAGDAVLLKHDAQDAEPKAAASATDWVKSLFGVFGRGAPA